VFNICYKITYLTYKFVARPPQKINYNKEMKSVMNEYRKHV